jgi:mono/diheme cytochrome c family protein
MVPKQVLERALRLQTAAWLALSVTLGSACDANAPGDHLFGTDSNGALPGAADAGSQAGADDDEDAGPPTSLARVECLTAKSSEPIPAREVAMKVDSTASSVPGVTTSDLFGKFVDFCGGCHTQGRNQGNFDVTLTSFAKQVNAESLMRIRSDDPMVGMPQPFMPFSKRAASDPLVKFASMLEQWIHAGNPDIFFPTTASAGDAGAAPGSAAGPFLLTRNVGMQMTNLGNCVPSAGMMTTAFSADAAKQLDGKFQLMQKFGDLPKKLSETDLISLDSAELAQHGVVAFAPGYPLWSDSAKKLRYVRVPVGDSIRFDEDKQTFDIPSNTRFYKTFLKQVTDLDGNVRYRKIETRLILSRTDTVDNQGVPQPNALFATYKWNESETEAILNDQPYSSDNTGFADDVFTYVVDERLEDKLLRQNLGEADLLAQGARRTYAIPGSDRCMHCHMGQPGFVLGFLPLQILRRATGVGGMVESTGPDELNQFDRLLQYGVISGTDSGSKVTVLENSQGSRKPRNDHELRAQGYMLGNCAHCHNPRGFPSRREPVLANVLKFLPSADDGGIFQFPLDRMSPRIRRGKNNDIQLPYITPSLFDHPDVVNWTKTSDMGKKWIIDPQVDGATVESFKDRAKSALKGLPLFIDEAGKTQTSGGDVVDAYGLGRPLLAPWRSLIYRNVDSPVTYEDSAAIYPHMPMDTSGYDCRARQLLGSWMASIPAQRMLASGKPDQTQVPAAFADYLELINGLAQPYVEIKPGAENYAAFASEAQARLARFQAGERYSDCPSPSLDIVAPEVASGQKITPLPQKTYLHAELGAEKSDYYALFSPARPHYAKTDLHDRPIWSQRRPDWYEILAEKAFDKERDDAGGSVAKGSAQAIAAVNSRKLSAAFKEFALTPVPFGLWQTKPECSAKLAAQPTVSAVPRAGWMDVVKADPSAPVYMISRGEQVFNTVCSKCHGPEATGASALANTMADLTGGQTRVANLRDGLFGPVKSPGGNRAPVFAMAAGHADPTCGTEPSADRCSNLTAEDWVARYVAWMGLGGTKAAIPSTVLSQIGSATVLGQSRFTNFAAVTDAKQAANMLGVAKEACRQFAKPIAFDPSLGLQVPAAVGKQPDFGNSLEGRGLIPRNGDLELWRSVCQFQNAAFVTGVSYIKSGVDPYSVGQVSLPSGQEQQSGEPALFALALYPISGPVGGSNGAQSNGLTPENSWPWCLYGSPPVADQTSYQAKFGHGFPMCPSSGPDSVLLANHSDPSPDPQKVFGVADGDPKFPPSVRAEDAVAEWAARGAANAGIAVYYWLDALARGQVKPTPGFDHCEQL